MKLFTRYNSLSLAATLLVFALVMVSLFFIVQGVLIEQLDESLLAERDKVLHYVKSEGELPETVKVYDQRIVFEEEPEAYSKFKFRTKYKEVNTEADELVRALYFGVSLRGKHYKVTVIRSLDEMEDLLLYISLLAAGALLVLLAALFLLNRFFIKKLLRPFYDTLAKVDNYRLASQESLQLPATNIHEFRLLNEKMTDLTHRIQQDYLVLKEFTGNAAHEMQTPLAVIRAQTDRLLQREGLSESEAEALQLMEQTTHKLARLHTSLLLLAKLESKPFDEKTEIRLDEAIEKKLAERTELMALSGIAVEKSLEPVSVRMHEGLAEIIVSNLLSNAVRFNHEGGKISIRLSQEKLVIANASGLPGLDGKKLFQRFYRHPSSPPDGTGLGLAIVQQAAALSGFTVGYAFDQGVHSFTLRF